jgi:hypothetical protein
VEFDRLRADLDRAAKHRRILEGRTYRGATQPIVR